MKKPTFTAALAQDQAPELPEPKAAKAGDGRINTTFRISPEGLEALKIVAAEKRTRVNDRYLRGRSTS